LNKETKFRGSGSGMFLIFDPSKQLHNTPQYFPSKGTLLVWDLVVSIYWLIMDEFTLTYWKVTISPIMRVYLQKLLRQDSFFGHPELVSGFYE